MPGKPIRKREVRVIENPVTRQLEVTQLDAVQRAFERIMGFIETEMMRLPDNPARYRLAEDVIARVEHMLPHQDLV